MKIKLLLTLFLLFNALFLLPLCNAEELKSGDVAPLFTLKNQDGKEFNLLSRKDKGWSVIYFYPKSETPGCTKQACAFRDTINKIRALNAEVYGISADTVEKQKLFSNNHQLTFDLLADPDSTVIAAYGIKIPVIGLAKRWTFIIDPSLTIRAIEKDVDPMLDAAKVVKIISELQKN